MRAVPIVILPFLFLTFSVQIFGQTLENCSTCSTQIIKEEQIKNASIDDFRFLTNDLYARKGYKFKSSDIDSYYSDKVWYKPVTDNNKIVYNAIEKQNIKLFQDKTLAIKRERESLIAELKNFKTSLLTNDTSMLSSKYGYSTTDKDYDKQYIYLKEAFSKINLDDINWSFDRGLYKATIDNGDIVMNYEIWINPDGFVIRYGNQGGTEIGKQLYPNDWITEFTFWWDFEWKNNKIKFVKINMAG